MLKCTAAADDPSVTAAATGVDDKTAAGIECAPVFLLCFSQKYEESMNCRKGYCTSISTLQII